MSARDGLVRFEGLQPAYNLLQRDQLDDGALDVCREHGLGVASYFGLARGFLTGKYRPGRRAAGDAPVGGRGAGLPERAGFAALEVVDEVAARARRDAGAGRRSPGSWHGPASPAPIASATSPDQVRELAGAMELTLTAEEMDRLDAAGR